MIQDGFIGHSTMKQNARRYSHVQPYGFIVDYRPIEYVQKYIEEANNMIVGLPEELADDDWIVWEFACDITVEEWGEI